jgi:hypothetical protein
VLVYAALMWPWIRRRLRELRAPEGEEVLAEAVPTEPAPEVPVTVPVAPATASTTTATTTTATTATAAARNGDV